MKAFVKAGLVVALLAMGCVVAMLVRIVADPETRTFIQESAASVPEMQARAERTRAAMRRGLEQPEVPSLRSLGCADARVFDPALNVERLRSMGATDTVDAGAEVTCHAPDGGLDCATVMKHFVANTARAEVEGFELTMTPSYERCVWRDGGVEKL